MAPGSTPSRHSPPDTTRTRPPPVKRFSLWNDRQSRLFTDPRALSARRHPDRHASGSTTAPSSRTNPSAAARPTARSEATSHSNGTASAPAAALTASIGSKTTTAGDGATSRSENLELLVAAVVIEVLPNGNLMIKGSQEVRVNAELRILTIGGIVRPTDIGADNTISYERIAEARISYGGRGRLTEVQQPPYGQQILDRFLPF